MRKHILVLKRYWGFVHFDHLWLLLFLILKGLTFGPEQHDNYNIYMQLKHKAMVFITLMTAADYTLQST